LPEVLEDIGDFVDRTLITVNDTPITVLSLAVFLSVLAIAILASRLIASAVAGRVARRFEVDAGTEFAVRRLVQYALTVAGVVFAFQFLGVDFSTLAVFFGFLSVGIGFGLQNVTSNFVSGLILLFERPIQVGDFVTVGDIEGDVLRINMRSTTVRSVRNISIIVPNSSFVSNEVINWSHGESRVALWVDVGVSYGSDLEAVVGALADVAEEHPEVLSAPPPEVRLVDFGDSSWNMRLIAWIADPHTNRRLTSELNMAIVQKFRERGVEIPFPQRDVHFKNQLTTAPRDA
jgi:small-conductance mechanosensitive channel